MANPGDAAIKLLYPADDGTFFTLDVLPPNTDYDVISNVEIGENLNEFVDEFVLRVAIINLTTATQVDLKEIQDKLVPAAGGRRSARRGGSSAPSSAPPPARTHP